MSVTEQILKHVRELPEDLQAQILDFVEYLESKNQMMSKEESQWAELSLSQAMRGMENEESLYSVEDIKETFS